MSNRRILGWICAGLCTLMVPQARSQTYEPAPDGLQAGRWFLSPYYTMGYEYDDNIFRRSESEDIVDDQLFSQTLGLLAYLPVRNSLLTLDTLIGRTDYSQTEFDQNQRIEFGVNFVANFGSNDRVTFNERFYDDFATVTALDGDGAISGGTGELFFTGEAYRRNDISLEWSRRLRGGNILFRVRRDDLNYDDRDVTSALIEYRGWNTVFDYQHRLPHGRIISFYGESRRFDNFKDELALIDPVSGQSPGVLDIPVGKPFRRELYDQVQVGSVGAMGTRQTYTVRLGVGFFRYETPDFTSELEDLFGAPDFGEQFLPKTSDFVGLVMTGRWRWQFGAASALEIAANRRPIASNFDTFYINNDLRADFEYQFGQFAYAGVRTIYGQNRYQDLVNIQGCETFVRQDERYNVAPYVNLQVHRRAQLEFSVEDETRTSNCDVVEFDYLSASMSLTFGWF